MLYYLFFFGLRPHLSALNVFRYITVRTAVASLTALMLSLLMGPWVIERLRALQVKQYIREEGPEGASGEVRHSHHGRRADRRVHRDSHSLWADLRNPYVLIALAATWHSALSDLSTITTR